MSGQLTIAHGNGKNQPSLVDFVRTSKADVAAAMESQQLQLRWDTLNAYRQTVAGRGWSEERDRAKSTRILTRTDLPNIGEMTRLASEKISAYEKYAPDRVLVVSMFEHPIAEKAGADGVAMLALHPDAGGMVSDPNQGTHRVVREYRESWETFFRVARMLRSDGLLIVGSTDAQMVANCAVPWNPARLARAAELPLRVRSIGFDWLFYDRRLHVGDFRTVDLFDHKGFIAELEPR